MMRAPQNPIQQPRRRPCAPRRGFTLLELMVALVMAGVLALCLVSTVQTAFAARKAAERAAGPARANEMAMEFIRQDFGGIMPPNPNWVDPNSSFSTGTSTSTSGTSTALYLAGSFVGTHDDTGRDGDSVVFYTTTDGPRHASADGEIKKVWLQLLTPDGASEPVLVRRVGSNLLSQQQVDPDDEVLCRRVRTFTLRYYDGTTWQTVWDSTTTTPVNELPAAIEVTLEMAPPIDDPRAVPRRYVRVFPVWSSTLVSDQSSTSSSSSTGGTTP